MSVFIKSQVISIPSTNAPLIRKNLKALKGTKRRQIKKEKSFISLLAKSNCKRKGTEIPDFIQFNELPRAICASDGLPNKGQKSNVLKFYQNRCKNLITSIIPSVWEPDTVILEGMFIINFCPLLINPFLTMPAFGLTMDFSLCV